MLDFAFTFCPRFPLSLNICMFVCQIDLEWKLIYVGSAEDETYDQQLESVLVGPVNVGSYRFILEVIVHSYSNWLL